MREYPADGRGQRRAQDQKSRPTKDRPPGQPSPSAPAAHSRNIQSDTLPLPCMITLQVLHFTFLNATTPYLVGMFEKPLQWRSIAQCCQVKGFHLEIAVS